MEVGSTDGSFACETVSGKSKEFYGIYVRLVLSPCGFFVYPGDAMDSRFFVFVPIAWRDNTNLAVSSGLDVLCFGRRRCGLLFRFRQWHPSVMPSFACETLEADT